jgi:hypothetical protein
VEPVEGRPPKTIDVPDEKGGTLPLLPGAVDPGGHDGGLHVPLRRIEALRVLNHADRLAGVVAARAADPRARPAARRSKTFE